MKNCSRCKRHKGTICKRWGFMPLWFFPRTLNVHKWKTILLCDDCLKELKRLK